MVKLEEVYVPDIGDFKDVPIIEIFVTEGQQVQVEDPLITLESDKATMDVPSPAAGKVNDLTVAVGDKVSQGDLIMVLEVETAAVGEATPEVAADEEAQQQLNLSSTDAAYRPPPAETAAAAEAPPQPTPSGPDASAKTIEVRVPDIGDFQDVDVIEVMVDAGDAVQSEDPLITLESDKATMDVPSPAPGTVVEMRVEKGDKVSEGSTILLLRTVEPDTAEATRKPTDRPSTMPPAAKQIPAAEETQRGPTPPTSLPPPVEEDGTAKSHASPSVRRFARELGVDLQRVRGSARKGRITKEDVQSYVKQQLAHPAQPSITAARAFTLPELPEIDFSKFGKVRVHPLSRIKKLSAANLHRSWLHVPHVTQHDEADITELENFRKQAKEEAAQRGVRLTLLAFLMKACVSALKKYPSFNASLDPSGENLVIKEYYHLGIAVDTADGLVVPVVRDVDQKGVLDLAQELGEISERARSKKLTPTDLQGGSFTISSLGGIGGTAFTPIVNAPEVAILGVSRAQMKPVYRDNEFTPRLMLPLSLSYDHRVVDGAEAARFTAFLTRVLEDARRLLL